MNPREYVQPKEYDFLNDELEVAMYEAELDNINKQGNNSDDQEFSDVISGEQSEDEGI